VKAGKTEDLKQAEGPPERALSQWQAGPQEVAWPGWGQGSLDRPP
jgi:hypothetical protein